MLEAYRDIAASPGPIGGGDVLVFLPGEREIRDVAELLERELPRASRCSRCIRAFPGSSRAAFSQRGARRRIVLATNVAETSITVPGIRAVIDSGLARISRYSPRSRLQRLPIEPVSRASAEQRKGRCGRLGPGLCLRLYSQEDFEARASSPSRRSCAPISRRCCCAWRRTASARRSGFRSSIRRTRARSNDGYRLLQELAGA